MTPEAIARLLEAHQVRPAYSRDGIRWACKTKACDFSAASSERAYRAEARHQSEVIMATIIGEHLMATMTQEATA